MTQKYINRFQKYIHRKYELDLLLKDNWVSFYVHKQVGITKAGEKTTLIAQAIFLEQIIENQTNILFRSHILTPQYTSLSSYEVKNPTREQVLRILASRSEAYINADTNNIEILKVIAPYLRMQKKKENKI